jgi:tetratricopeptide (TPR) repeat protein
VVWLQPAGKVADRGTALVCSFVSKNNARQTQELNVIAGRSTVNGRDVWRQLTWLALGAALWALPGSAPAQPPATSRQMLLEASRWMAQGQREQALKAYQAALAVAETDDLRAQALLGLANVHRALRDPEARLEALRQVEKLPEAPAAFVHNARRQLLVLYREEGDLAAARAVGEKLLAEAKTPGDGVAIAISLAEMDLEEDQPGAAAARLEPLLQAARDGRRLDAFYSLLIAARIMDDKAPQAVELARQAWQELPERPDLLQQAAQGLAERGHVREGLALLQEAFAAAPDNRQLLRALHDLHEQSDQIKRLTDWLDKSARGPQVEAWLQALALVYEWDGQLTQAVAAQEQLIARRPQDAPLLQAAGQLALRAQDYARAEKWLRQALALAPADEGLIVAVGEANLRQGKLQQALAVWREGLGYAADKPETVRRLGSLLAQHELWEAALEVYREGRQASGERTAYALNIGDAHEKLGALPEAVYEYTVALTTTDRMQGAMAATTQLYRLAEDDLARPHVVAALQVARDRQDLPAEGLGVLLFARALAGEDARALLANVPDEPDVATVLRRVAGRLEARQQPELALPFYERSHTGDLIPGQAAVMAVRVAELQLQTGDWQAAQATLQQGLAASVEGAPQAAELRARLARQLGDVLLRQARQPTEAIGAYEMALRAAPDGLDARLARWGQADALFALGETEQALADYRRLAAMSAPETEYDPDGVPGLRRSVGAALPGEDYVYAQAAEALLRQGQLDKAAEAFHKLAAAAPDSAHANDALRRMLLIKRLQQAGGGGGAYLGALKAWERGEVDEAVRLLEPLVVSEAASPLADIALSLLARIRFWQRDVAGAVRLYDELVTRCADSAEAPAAAFTAAMIVSQTDRTAARQRLQALVAQFPEAIEAEEAALVLRAWEQQPGGAAAQTAP